MNILTVTIREDGTPLLMHNGQLADPLNPLAKDLARLTSKRKKTEADHLELRRCEWFGGLYVDDAGHPCLPGEVLEAALVEGAKKFRMGKAAKGGFVVFGNFRLDYKGPKTADELWKTGRFIKSCGVRVKQNRVIRSRPEFKEWSCTFEVGWNPEIFKDQEEVLEIIAAAGKSGIGDWRPKFGRFEIVKVAS